MYLGTTVNASQLDLHSMTRKRSILNIYKMYQAMGMLNRGGHMKNLNLTGVSTCRLMYYCALSGRRY